MLLPLDGPGIGTALSVTTTAQEVKVGGSPLAERKVVTIQPLDGDIYYGYDSGTLNSTTGTLVYQGQLLHIEAGESLPIYIVAGTGTVDVRITEVS